MAKNEKADKNKKKAGPFSTESQDLAYMRAFLVKLGVPEETEKKYLALPGPWHLSVWAHCAFFNKVPSLPSKTDTPDTMLSDAVAKGLQVLQTEYGSQVKLSDTMLYHLSIPSGHSARFIGFQLAKLRHGHKYSFEWDGPPFVFVDSLFDANYSTPQPKGERPSLKKAYDATPSDVSMEVAPNVLLIGPVLTTSFLETVLGLNTVRFMLACRACDIVSLKIRPLAFFDPAKLSLVVPAPKTKTGEVFRDIMAVGKDEQPVKGRHNLTPAQYKVLQSKITSHKLSSVQFEYDGDEGSPPTGMTANHLLAGEPLGTVLDMPSVVGLQGVRWGGTGRYVAMEDIRLEPVEDPSKLFWNLTQQYGKKCYRVSGLHEEGPTAFNYLVYPQHAEHCVDGMVCMMIVSGIKPGEVVVLGNDANQPNGYLVVGGLIVHVLSRSACGVFIQAADISCSILHGMAVRPDGGPFQFDRRLVHYAMSHMSTGGKAMPGPDVLALARALMSEESTKAWDDVTQYLDSLFTVGWGQSLYTHTSNLDILLGIIGNHFFRILAVYDNMVVFACHGGSGNGGYITWHFTQGLIELVNDPQNEYIAQVSAALSEFMAHVATVRRLVISSMAFVRHGLCVVPATEAGAKMVLHRSPVLQAMQKTAAFTDKRMIASIIGAMEAREGHNAMLYYSLRDEHGVPVPLGADSDPNRLTVMRFDQKGANSAPPGCMQIVASHQRCLLTLNTSNATSRCVPYRAVAGKAHKELPHDSGDATSAQLQALYIGGMKNGEHGAGRVMGTHKNRTVTPEDMVMEYARKHGYGMGPAGRDHFVGGYNQTLRDIEDKGIAWYSYDQNPHTFCFQQYFAPPHVTEPYIQFLNRALFPGITLPPPVAKGPPVELPYYEHEFRPDPLFWTINPKELPELDMYKFKSADGGSRTLGDAVREMIWLDVAPRMRVQGCSRGPMHAGWLQEALEDVMRLTSFLESGEK